MSALEANLIVRELELTEKLYDDESMEVEIFNGNHSVSATWFCIYTFNHKH